MTGPRGPNPYRQTPEERAALEERYRRLHEAIDKHARGVWTDEDEARYLADYGHWYATDD